MKPATKSDWHTHPLPPQRETLPLDHFYSPAEMEKIKHGHVPETMEDKWFIYWAEGVLHFHRSWTGICIFEMPLAREDGRYVVSEVQVNRLTAEYGSMDDAYDAALVLYLVDVLLLERFETAFPSAKAEGLVKTMQTWHVVGRAMLGQKPNN